MNKKTHTSGFTLIELLVVIAIIGILSAIVLASLTSARNKSVDAAAKSNFTNARKQAELYFDTNGSSYSGACTNATGIGTPVVKSMYTFMQQVSDDTGLTANFSSDRVPTTVRAGDAAKVTCNDDANGWAAEVPLRSSTLSGATFCIDSKGSTIVTTNHIARYGTVCN